jgi:hypothetical protein
MTLILGVICMYCYAKAHIKPIVDNWPNERCKPYYIPIAGFITKPDNMSASDYTVQNFNYCTQNILKSITGFMVEPITFITSGLTDILNYVISDIDNIRNMFNKIRTFVSSIIQSVFGVFLNLVIDDP